MPFKNHVLSYREAKIDEKYHEKVFNADVVMGEEAKTIGLIDEIGDVDTVIKEKFEDLKIENFSKQSKW